MRIPTIVLLATATLAATAPLNAETPAFKGAKLAGQARLTLTAARHIALRARPGTITDQELEKEKGGSGLRYSFDITASGKPYEVGVDARTGAVLENGVEGKNPD